MLHVLQWMKTAIYRNVVSVFLILLILYVLRDLVLLTSLNFVVYSSVCGIDIEVAGDRYRSVSYVTTNKKTGTEYLILVSKVHDEESMEVLSTTEIREILILFFKKSLRVSPYKISVDGSPIYSFQENTFAYFEERKLKYSTTLFEANTRFPRNTMSADEIKLLIESIISTL